MFVGFTTFDFSKSLWHVFTSSCAGELEQLSIVLIFLLLSDDGGSEISFLSNFGETESKPRDNLSISAPNKCNAVIVEGVGSGTL